MTESREKIRFVTVAEVRAALRVDPDETLAVVGAYESEIRVARKDVYTGTSANCVVMWPPDKTMTTGGSNGGVA